jgi:hypothetical protein
LAEPCPVQQIALLSHGAGFQRFELYQGLHVPLPATSAEEFSLGAKLMAAVSRRCPTRA